MTSIVKTSTEGHPELPPGSRRSAPLRVAPLDLPLCCPRPGDALWNMHPRVYLPIEQAPGRRATCPYCGTLYELEGLRNS